ncbi:MAG: V-type ATP synthase subunit B, partial [Clostridiales bacterium]|nr:V-type ATP synthase subunit B [Clostridiales bacterium]
MRVEHLSLRHISGPLVVLDGVKDAANEELVTLRLQDGGTRSGRVIQIQGETVVVQVFEGTSGLSLENTRVELTGRPMELPLSPEILGRTFNGTGRPIDGLGAVYPECCRDINGMTMNPMPRTLPRRYINTRNTA